MTGISLTGFFFQNIFTAFSVTAPDAFFQSGVSRCIGALMSKRKRQSLKARPDESPSLSLSQTFARNDVPCLALLSQIWSPFKPVALKDVHLNHDRQKEVETSSMPCLC